MKKLIILLLFIPLVSFGQSISNLEANSGYRSFKINSYKSIFENNLQFVNEKEGYSTYTYVKKHEYEIVNEYITFTKKTNLYSIANRYDTTANYLRELNPKMKVKKGFIKKQKLLIPVKKISKTFPIDNSFFKIFDYKINNISLTYDSEDKLKKITLNLDEKVGSNRIALLGFRLKELYTKFAEIIGPTTHYNKPTPDCQRFKSQSCLYFEDKVIDWEIIWESKNIILRIIHKTKLKDLENLSVSRSISFSDRKFDKYLKNTLF